jgi:hypothetical protein
VAAPADISKQLNARLRRPSKRHSVSGSLPVLFFGDLYAAEVATVGLNPSQQEYLTPRGELLAGVAQRFATLDSLRAPDRESLSDEQCAEALRWMRDYYAPGQPVYRWFIGLERVLRGFGASLAGRTAAHLDLVQESTSPVWSGLSVGARDDLLRTDLPFLRWEIASFPLQRWEIASFPLRAVICTSKTVSDHVRGLLEVDLDDAGELARIRWWTGRAVLDGRNVGVCGWNLPLARPTGLGAAGERELGELLARRLEALAT